MLRNALTAAKVHFTDGNAELIGFPANGVQPTVIAQLGADFCRGKGPVG